MIKQVREKIKGDSISGKLQVTIHILCPRKGNYYPDSAPYHGLKLSTQKARNESIKEKVLWHEKLHYI